MSNYKPAESGLSKYFFAMLDDADRNDKYSAAIKLCIAEFWAIEGHGPRVLDLGVGTGMLSALCLEHGCAHVTGVDTNETMCGLANQALAKISTRKSFQILHVQPGKIAPGLQGVMFDMVVSEILGTTTTSESMCKYLSFYANHIRTFGAEERVYMVPQITRQFLSIHAFECEALGRPLCTLLDAALASIGHNKLVPTNEGCLGINLSLYPSRLVGEPMLLHSEVRDGPTYCKIVSQFFQ